MPDDSSQPPGNRHQIIHWNPGHETAQEPPPARSSNRTLYLVLGGCALFVVTVGLTWLVFSLSNRQTEPSSGPASYDSLAIGEALSGDPRALFVSRSRAELSRDTASRSLAEFRRMPAEHPRILQEMIIMEKEYLEGERLLERSDFRDALLQFELVNQKIENFSEQIALRRRAKEGYDNFLVRIERLEMGRNLAPSAYNRAFSAASEGRQFLEQGSFQAAATKLDEADAAMDEIEAAVANILERNMLDGRQALAMGNKEAALNAFSLVLDMNPENEEAVRGLKRAETIDKLDDLLGDAFVAEETEDYKDSLSLFEEAQATDALSAKAQQGVARLKKKIKDRDFNNALTAADDAKADDEWELAITAYEQALEVYPRRDEVRELLQEARETNHEMAVQRSLATAYAYENDRDWMGARKAYLTTLGIETKLEEAEDGLVRTSRMLRVILRYEKLLELASDQAAQAEFQSAIRSFNEAISIKPDYIQLTPDQITVKDLLSAQSKPVGISFISDGKTWVTISNYKLLGKFKEESVKILPGDYEILGRRKGFVDVLLLLPVRAGSPPPTVTVVCDKKLTR